MSNMTHQTNQTPEVQSQYFSIEAPNEKNVAPQAERGFRVRSSAAAAYDIWSSF
jgi:hypothetical protein